MILSLAVILSFAGCVSDTENETSNTETVEQSTGGGDTVTTQENTTDITENSTENNTQISDTESDTETNTGSETETESETESETQDPYGVELLSPKNNDEVVLANETIYSWWQSFRWNRTDSQPYRDKHEDQYYPVPVRFEWSTETEADQYRFHISKNADMSDCQSYFINASELEIDALFVGTTYYWQVDAVYADRCESSKIFSFTTADSPRALRIDGVSNTRDIGGLSLKGGYRIKQGMIYRGGKLDDITESGKAFMLNELGIVTDLDLRTAGEGSAGGGSPLGRGVNYVLIDGRYYTGDKGVETDEGKALFAQEIRLFADPDNYPIYIHCSLGRDRTGTLVMVIEGLLGMTYNNMIMDYEMYVFSVSGTLHTASVKGMRAAIDRLHTYIDSFEGEDFSEKVENYLLSIGITAEEIQTIRDLLTEKAE